MHDWSTPQYLLIAFWLLLIWANLWKEQQVINGNTHSWLAMLFGQLVSISYMSFLLWWGGFF